MSVSLTTYLCQLHINFEYCTTMLLLQISLTGNKVNYTYLLWKEIYSDYLHCCTVHVDSKKKLRGLSPRANYTHRAAAAGRRS